VGDLYCRGEGVEKSIPEGVKWLRLASEDGNAAARLLLAALLLRGETESAYPNEPVDLLTRAAAQGSVDAEYNLGVCFRLGLRVARDLDMARYWYRRAALHDQPSAQIALGDLLLATANGEADQAEAARWYETAALAGVPGANLSLGRLYEQGLGVPRDLAKATACFRRAAQAGVPGAEEALRAFATTE
jgi:TPR repeat protein